MGIKSFSLFVKGVGNDLSKFLNKKSLSSSKKEIEKSNRIEVFTSNEQSWSYFLKINSE